MTVAAAVRLEAVGKRFDTEAGPVHAVDDVSLDLAAGVSLAVTGPSGCGKSTLLSLIGALEPPSAGRVHLGETVVSQLGAGERAALRREQIGFVFQSDNLQSFLTAGENVGLQLALSGAEHGFERVTQLLGALGLQAAVDKYPDQLSGGERQRVAVARALVHRPRLILADEPTGALDPDNSCSVVDLLLQAAADVEATLVVITHDPTVAARLDREIELADGRIAGSRVAHA